MISILYMDRDGITLLLLYFNSLTKILRHKLMHDLGCRIRTGQDNCFQARHLTLAELGRLPRLGPIAQSGDAFGIVALNPVAQGLPVHPSLANRAALARFIHSVERISNRDQPGADPSVALPPGLPAQFPRTDVIPDPQSRHCGHSPTTISATRQPRRCNSFGESVSNHVGTIRI